LGLIGLFKLINASVLVIVVAAIAWRQTGRALAVGAVVALTLAHPGMHVREGQIEPLLAAGIGALWLWPSGWLAVAGGLVKLHPLGGLVWVARKRGPIVKPVLFAIAGVAVWALIFPDLWRDWLSSTVNMRADCNAIGWPSVTCVTGIRWVGPAIAAIMLLGTWRVRSDKVAFLLLSLAILVAAPDTYASYWLIPWVGALPLLLTEPRVATWRRPGSPQATPVLMPRETNWHAIPIAAHGTFGLVPITTAHPTAALAARNQEIGDHHQSTT
jgi:hypothetical protein